MSCRTGAEGGRLMAVGKRMHRRELDHSTLEQRRLLFGGKSAFPERARQRDELANGLGRLLQLGQQAHLRNRLLPRRLPGCRLASQLRIPIKIEQIESIVREAKS